MIGRYTCTARNIAGNVTRTVYFQVKIVCDFVRLYFYEMNHDWSFAAQMQAMAPKIRSHRYERKYVRLSHTARMTCSAIGVPSPSISWTAPNGNRILQNVVSFTNCIALTFALLESLEFFRVRISGNLSQRLSQNSVKSKIILNPNQKMSRLMQQQVWRIL